MLPIPQRDKYIKMSQKERRDIQMKLGRYLHTIDLDDMIIEYDTTFGKVKVKALIERKFRDTTYGSKSPGILALKYLSENKFGQIPVWVEHYYIEERNTPNQWFWFQIKPLNDAALELFDMNKEIILSEYEYSMILHKIRGIKPNNETLKNLSTKTGKLS